MIKDWKATKSLKCNFSDLYDNHFLNNIESPGKSPKHKDKKGSSWNHSKAL